MKREAAERIVQAVMKIDHIFGELDGVFNFNLIDDAGEKNKMRRAFAMLLLDLHERVTLEVGNSILICIPTEQVVIQSQKDETCTSNAWSRASPRQVT